MSSCDNNGGDGGAIVKNQHTSLQQLINLSNSLMAHEVTNEVLQNTIIQHCRSNSSHINIQYIALIISFANAKLRASFARAHEYKRQNLIRMSAIDSSNVLKARLENAFQMDWFALSHLNNKAEDDMYSLLDTFSDTQTLQFLNQCSDIDDIHSSKVKQALQTSLRILSDHIADSSSPINTPSHSISKCSEFKRCTYGFYSHGELIDTTPQEYIFDYECDDCIIVTSSANDSDDIKCGSLNKLIERLTDERHQDLNLTFVFLLTYHSFTSARVLLDKLVHRYFIPDPPNATIGEIQYFRRNRRQGIQLKVLNVLKKWVEDHFSDFEEDEQLRKYLIHLLENTLNKTPWASKLSSTISSLLLKQQSGVSRNQALTMKCPRPAIRSSTSVIDIHANFLSVSSLEVARQLSIGDFEVFRQIKPRECLNQAWSKVNKNVIASNIMRMIHRFNHCSHWTQALVLNQITPSLRIAMLKKMIRIAEHCLSLNNFASACAIFSGLQSTPLHRLHKLWQQLGNKYRTYHDRLCQVFRPDTKSRMRFRKKLQEAIPPCIPHLGLFLSDLTFIEDGNPDHINGLINFTKRCKLSNRIMWIKQYQQAGYQLEKIPAVHAYLESEFRARNDETLYERSKAIQP